MLRKDSLDTPPALSSTEELKKFEAFAAQWWNNTGRFAMVHAFNAQRVLLLRYLLCEYFERDVHAPQPLAGLHILDLGCGGGLLCEPLAKMGAHVLGIDGSGKSIAVARWHAKQQNLHIDYRHCLIEKLAEDAQFDVVLNTEVIEHVEAPHALVEQCCARVKLDGLLFMATLNRSLSAFFRAIIGAEYVLRVLPRGTHQWRAFVKPDELRNMADAFGMHCCFETGIDYRLWQKKWCFTPSLSVNYAQAFTWNAQATRLSLPAEFIAGQSHASI